MSLARVITRQRASTHKDDDDDIDKIAAVALDRIVLYYNLKSFIMVG